MSDRYDFITSGFIDALSVWSEYRSGQRDFGWGPGAAHYLFMTSGLGLPNRPPSAAEQLALVDVAATPTKDMQNPADLKPGRRKQLIKDLGLAAGYLEDAFSLRPRELDFGPLVGAPATMKDALQYLKSTEFDSRPQAPTHLSNNTPWALPKGQDCVITDENEWDDPPPGGALRTADMVRSVPERELVAEFGRYVE